MNCQKKDKFPLSPQGKKAWPWTDEILPVPATMPDGSPWPKISIVTPSYNQGQFIEETIRSILLQGYPNLEYIIIDGGSCDNSVEIIKKYEPWVAYWVSEKDNGQSHAINKGWQKASGDILAYLNSDDTYQPGTLFTVATYFDQHPDGDMVYGGVHIIDGEGAIISAWPARQFNLSQYIKDPDYFIPQQGAFFRRRVLDRTGFLDEHLHFKMDRDLFIRIGIAGNVAPIPWYLASFRAHPDAKSTLGNFHQTWDEFFLICRGYGGSVPTKTWLKYCWAFLKQRCLVYPIEQFEMGRRIVWKIRKMNLRRELKSFD